MNAKPRWWALAAFLGVSVLAVALLAQQSTSLVVNGQQGSAKVAQLQGHDYVEIDGLARITNGTISFKGSQIVLSLPGMASAPAAPPQPQGASKEFLMAGMEAMARVREWHSALKTAIEKGVPLTTGWLDLYQSQAQQALTLASAVVSTDVDRAAYPLLLNEFNNMKALNEKYVGINKSLTYISPNSLDSDSLNQKIVDCGHALAAMAGAKQMMDAPACQ